MSKIAILRKTKKILVDKEITAIIISTEVGALMVEDEKSLKVYKVIRTAKGLQMMGA